MPAPLPTSMLRTPAQENAVSMQSTTQRILAWFSWLGSRDLMRSSSGLMQAYVKCCPTSPRVPRPLYPPPSALFSSKCYKLAAPTEPPQPFKASTPSIETPSTPQPYNPSLLRPLLLQPQPFISIPSNPTLLHLFKLKQRFQLFKP
eukprot:3049424-Rhodomonas_salina.1